MLLHSMKKAFRLTFRYDEFAYWSPFLDMSQNSVIVYDCDATVAVK